MSLNAEPRERAFFHRVWAFVRAVPLGRVVTYGQIAQAIPGPAGLPAEEYSRSGSRLVGSALAACPLGVPWHRVINAQGRVSSRPDAQRQQALLEAEGLCFLGGRLDLANVQWHGGAQSERPKQPSLF